MKSIKVIFCFFIMLFLLNCSNKENEKVLVYNIFSAPKSLDPHISSDSISMQISNSLHSSLLKLDGDKIVGNLAKSFEKIDNKYIFEIREDAKYSDGSKVQAEDILNSFYRILDKNTKSQYASMLEPIKNAKNFLEGKATKEELGVYVQDNKLVIELENDVTYFPYILTLPLTVPYKEGLYTGPFMLESENEQELVLVKNPNYFNQSEVKLNKLKYVYFNDYSVINNLIQNGDIDISRVDKELLGEGVNTYTDGRIWFIDYNFMTNDNLKNIHLRKAISLSIDRQKYVDVIKADGSKKALNVISDILNYTPDYLISDIDVNLAKEELQKAKQELGKDDIKIELLSGNTPIEVKEVQYIQEQISTNLGIEVTIKTVPYKERLALIKDNNYDIALNTYSPKYLDPLAILDRFMYKSKKVEIFNQKEYQELVESARKTTENRDEIIKKAEKLLLENMVISPLYYSIENQYISKRVSGVKNYPLGNVTDLSGVVIK